MTDFTKEYVELLIKQYYTKPKARAEIEATVGAFENAFGIIRDFPDAFDVDTATGDRLDKIGKIVGVPRTVPLVLAKIGFGFADNDNARGFANRFNASVISAPFYDRFTPPYTDQQLNDFDYRLIIKAKIAVNNTSAFMDSDERISIQDVIQTAFNGEAYVVDKKNMTFWLYITPLIDLDRLRLLVTLKLLPKPQGVRYHYIVQAVIGDTFGFADNPNAVKFGDKFDPDGFTGMFANKVVI